MQQQSLNEQLWPDYQRCFGCGAENELGLQLNLYERAGAVISRWEPRPKYANFWGIVHGGVLTVALDELWRRRTVRHTNRVIELAWRGYPVPASAR